MNRGDAISIAPFIENAIATHVCEGEEGPVGRRIATLLRSRLRRMPAVALLGPRQCGKTTLAKALGDEYFDLEKLNRHADLVKADRRFLVSRTRSTVSNGRVTSCDLQSLAEEIAAL